LAYSGLIELYGKYKDCDSSSTTTQSADFASSGTVEITARDKNGQKITKLDGPVTVTLPTLTNKDRKTCIGYQQSKGTPFKCDDSKSKVCIVHLIENSIECMSNQQRLSFLTCQSQKSKNVNWLSQDFDHLTTFAVFFQFGGSIDCGNTKIFWIASLALLGKEQQQQQHKLLYLLVILILITLIGALPFAMGLFVFIVTRFKAGRILIYGERQGMSMKQMKKMLKTIAEDQQNQQHQRHTQIL